MSKKRRLKNSQLRQMLVSQGATHVYPAWKDKVFFYGGFRIISTSIMKIRRIASENS